MEYSTTAEYARCIFSVAFLSNLYITSVGVGRLVGTGRGGGYLKFSKKVCGLPLEHHSRILLHIERSPRMIQQSHVLSQSSPFTPARQVSCARDPARYRTWPNPVYQHVMPAPSSPAEHKVPYDSTTAMLQDSLTCTPSLLSSITSPLWILRCMSSMISARGRRLTKTR